MRLEHVQVLEKPAVKEVLNITEGERDPLQPKVPERAEGDLEYQEEQLFFVIGSQ